LFSAADEDYFEDDDDDGITPGPGSYFNPKQSTTFKVKDVPERLQFFGSTVERFNANASKVIPSNIGPGSYSVATSATAASKKMRNTNYVPFQSSNQRFQEKQQQVEIPGPG
jgi:hypothetical protein